MYYWTILVFLFPSMRQFKLSVSNLIRNRYWREGCWDFDLLEQLNSSPILNYVTLWHKLTTILVIQRYCGNLCYAAELVQNMVQWILCTGQAQIKCQDNANLFWEIQKDRRQDINVTELFFINLINNSKKSLQV